jgi:hypothetical protein
LELHHKNNILKTHIVQEGFVVPPPPDLDYDDNFLPEDGKMQKNPSGMCSTNGQHPPTIIFDIETP